LMASGRDHLREASDSVASLPSRTISIMREGGVRMPKRARPPGAPMFAPSPAPNNALAVKAA
jgi:hypothetical protein